MLEQNLNFEIKAGKKRLAYFDNVATKVGGLLGEKGRELGERIDEVTKDITVKQDVLSYDDDKSELNI